MSMRPSKKTGIIAGAVIGVITLLGVAGSQQQTPSASIAPASTNAAQTSAPETPSISVTPAPSASATVESPPKSTSPSSGDSSSSSGGSLSNNDSYTNVDGDTVHSPAYSSNDTVPAGATARCEDGTYSFSQHRRGTCSHHGGVSGWL